LDVKKTKSPPIGYAFHRRENLAGSFFDFPVQIVSFGREIRSSSSYRNESSRHTLKSRAHIFQYTLAGSGIFEYSKNGSLVQERVEPGKYFLASYDVSYKYYYDGIEPWEFFFISFRGDYADLIVKHLTAKARVLPCPEDSPPVRFLHELLEKLGYNDSVDKYFLSTITYTFLTSLLKLSETSNSQSDAHVRKLCKKYILENLQSIDTESLARCFALHKKYFNVFCKKHTGQTPNNFIQTVKIAEAKKMLSSRSITIREAARHTGFSDEGYFSKVFKRLTGITPGEYREKILNGERSSEVNIYL